MLCTQRSDWQKFRRNQLKQRRLYGAKFFHRYVERVRERRQRHNLSDDVRLCLNQNEQSQLKNWIEFQHYHLKRLEELGEGRIELYKTLDDVQKETMDADRAKAERALRDVTGIQRRLGYNERLTEGNKTLLQWIEQKRTEMVLNNSKLVEENSNNQDAVATVSQRTSTRSYARRQPSVLLDNAGFSKATTLKNRKKQTEKSKVSKSEPSISNPPAFSKSDAPQAPKHGERKTKHTDEERPLRQLRPQRVSKKSRLEGAISTSSSGKTRGPSSQTRALDNTQNKRQLASQLSHAANSRFVTRYGRSSVPPARWV